MGIDWIDQYADVTNLNEECGVADISHHHLLRSGADRPPRLHRDLFRPPCPGSKKQARNHPKRLTLRAVRIEETAAVEVVGEVQLRLRPLLSGLLHNQAQDIIRISHPGGAILHPNLPEPLRKVEILLDGIVQVCPTDLAEKSDFDRVRQPLK